MFKNFYGKGLYLNYFKNSTENEKAGHDSTDESEEAK